ncbi:MAG: ROK family protein [Christensenellales bacterium]
MGDLFFVADIGGTSVKAGLYDKEDGLIIKDAFVTDKSLSYKKIISDTAACAHELLRRVGIDIKRVKAVGVGIPGLPNRETGEAAVCPNLSWLDVPFSIEMAKHISAPVYIENDANLAALAEHTVGACKGWRHSMTVTLGTGVGSGIIIDNCLFTGSRGAGAELGHITLVYGGEKCGCGKSGCLERYCSASALACMGKEEAEKDGSSLMNAAKEGITPKTVISCAKSGDKAAGRAFSKYVDYLSHGLLSAVSLFDTEIIALGGGLSHAGEILFNPVRERMAQMRMYKNMELLKVVPAVLGNDAGLVGAGLLCALKEKA